MVLPFQYNFCPPQPPLPVSLSLSLFAFVGSGGRSLRFLVLTLLIRFVAPINEWPGERMFRPLTLDPTYVGQRPPVQRFIGTFVLLTHVSCLWQPIGWSRPVVQISAKRYWQPRLLTSRPYSIEVQFLLSFVVVVVVVVCFTGCFWCVVLDVGFVCLFFSGNLGSLFGAGSNRARVSVHFQDVRKVRL